MNSYRIVQYSGYKMPKAYQALVYAEWMRSLRFGNDYMKMIETNVYYTTYRAYITKLLDHPESQVRLAVLEEDPDIVLGFSVHRTGILDYVFVQREMRKAGIAKKLVPVGIDTITHITKSALAIMGKNYTKWPYTFNPFA